MGARPALDFRLSVLQALNFISSHATNAVQADHKTIRRYLREERLGVVQASRPFR